MSDYKLEVLDEKDNTTNEKRVLETTYHPEGEDSKNLVWEAYRDGYCSFMHTIIKLEKQIIAKEAENAK